MNVAEAIVDRLKAAGTEYFFLLTGGDQPLWIALHEAGIKMIVARSEFSSVYMADGYARASGKPGITYGQAGPGAANVAAALADPFWAQSAVVALTGATATDRMYKGEYQSLDQMPMFSTVTNWNGFAANPEQVPELVSFAINRAITGSRGPAHLDIPKNFFSLDIEYNALGYKESEALSPGLPDTKAVREALKELLSAKKPVILIGEGALISGACNAIAAFAEKLNIPLATTMGGKSCIGWAHPLNLGVVGRYSSKIANDYVGESDCVLVIGSRMGGLATRGYTIPNRKAKVIMINNDPTVFDISYHPSIKLVSDAKRTMEAFLKEIKDNKLIDTAKTWSDKAKQTIQEWRNGVRAVTIDNSKGSFLSPFKIMEVISKYNNDITVVADTGYMAAWTGVLYKTIKPQSYFRAVGSLGWAFPASLGVQLARSEKVVCVTGDGGFGYHIADIETAVRLHIPIIVLVLNNSGFIFEYHEQKYRHNGRIVPEANDLSDVDYSSIARGFGARGIRVQSEDEFEKEFKAALLSDKPTVIDVVIDREAFPPVSNFEKIIKRKI